MTLGSWSFTRACTATPWLVSTASMTNRRRTARGSSTVLLSTNVATTPVAGRVSNWMDEATFKQRVSKLDLTMLVLG